MRMVFGGGTTTCTTKAWCRKADNKRIARFIQDDSVDDPRPLDHADDVDAHARTNVGGRGDLLPRDVDRDDGSDDAAVIAPDALAVPSVCSGRRESPAGLVDRA